MLLAQHFFEQGLKLPSCKANQAAGTPLNVIYSQEVWIFGSGFMVYGPLKEGYIVCEVSIGDYYRRRRRLDCR